MFRIGWKKSTGYDKGFINGGGRQSSLAPLGTDPPPICFVVSVPIPILQRRYAPAANSKIESKRFSVPASGAATGYW